MLVPIGPNFVDWSGDEIVTSVDDLEDVIRWQIFVRKNIDGAEPMLGVYFYIENEEKEVWSSVVSSKIKLISSTGEALVHYIVPYLYSNERNNFGADEVIPWKDLLDPANNYVQNGAIKLDMEMNFQRESKSELICKVRKSCDEGCVTKIALKVLNASSLNIAQSEIFTMRSSKWKLSMYKHQRGTLGMHLFLVEMKEEKETMAHEVTMTAKIKSSKPNVEAVVKSKSAIMGHDGTLDLADIISWDELFNLRNGFFKNIECDMFEIAIKIECSKAEHVPFPIKCEPMDEVDGK